MAVKKGDTVFWRGRDAKVMAPPSEDGAVTLHVGQGQIVWEAKDYTELPAPKPVSTKKPARAPIAKAPRKRSTGKGK